MCDCDKLWLCVAHEIAGHLVWLAKETKTFVGRDKWEEGYLLNQLERDGIHDKSLPCLKVYVASPSHAEATQKAVKLFSQSMCW